MITYKLPFVRLFCATIFLTHALMPMDIRYRGIAARRACTDKAENIFLEAPLGLLMTPWYQKLWVAVRKCRCWGRSEDEYGGNEVLTTANLETQEAKIPVVLPVLLPPSDNEGIEQHYYDSKIRLENALEHAPQKAKELLDMIKFPDLYREKVRIMILYGPPGVAKSTLARAIAYKAGWFLELITGRQIRAKYRGQTSINLQRKLEAIAHKKQNTVIVIDEINRLFEQYNSSRHDTGDTAEDFWTFLDDQRRNKRLYIIGTTNHVDKLPPQILSRVRNRFIKVTQAATLEDAGRDFVRAITEYHGLSPECDAAFLQELLAPLYQKKCNIRDFESIEESAIRIARRTDKLSPKLVFTQRHLQEAVTDILETDPDIKYGAEKLSEDDQNQENHREHLRQQRELHDETIQFQKDQFVKGIRVQKAMQTNQKSTSSGGAISVGTGGAGVNYSWNSGINNESSNDESITNHLSDEEIRIYREQCAIAESRNRECERVKQLLDVLRVKVDAFNSAQKQLLSASDEQARALVGKITGIVQAYTTCVNKFSGLTVPSEAELVPIRNEITGINQQSDALKRELEQYASQHAGCTIL